MKFLSVIIISLLFISHSNADNLFLNGTLIDIYNDTAIIDIKSESCMGERKFKISKDVNLEQLKRKINKTIYITIQENECDDLDKTYTIIEVQ